MSSKVNQKKGKPQPKQNAKKEKLQPEKPPKGKRQIKGGGMLGSLNNPSYNSGGTSGGDFGANIGGMLVYLPASIFSGISAITATIKLPSEISGMITEAGTPTPQEEYIPPV